MSHAIAIQKENNVHGLTAQIIPFRFESSEVRALLIEGEPWFVAVDVCRILGQSNTTKALQSLDDDERSNFKLGRQGSTNIISESGLYTLILRCDAAIKKGSDAHRFRKWVTAEVLPAVRRAGQYHDTSNKMTTLVDALIGMTEVNVIKGLIRDKAKVIPIDLRRSFQHTMHNRLHTRFNVPRVELIPAQQFEAACNFVAAYALEGEWLPKDEPKKTLALSCPIEELTKRRPAMLVEKAGERTWLDVTLHDLRDIRGMPTPCEAILYELQKHGFDIEGAWWELRTYRNKLSGLEARIKGLCMELEDPHRYAV